MKNLNSIEGVIHEIKDADNVSCIYQYGSHVYGSNDDESDLDFIIINFFGDADHLSHLQTGYGFDLHALGWVSAWNKLNAHEPMLVEIFFLPKQFRIQELDLFLDGEHIFEHWKLDKSKLRRSFSQTSSNSWVKAKKKLTVSADYDLRAARKSLFHSFRLLDLGVQLAQGITEPDFSSANHILDEVNSLEGNWSIWDATFRQRHNALLTKFRQVCPK